MEKIKEIFIDGERIYLKEDVLGWHVTHPIKIDGKLNLKNLIAGGSWFKLILIVIFVLIMLFAIFEYAESLRYCSELIAEKVSLTQINPEILLKPIP